MSHTTFPTTLPTIEKLMQRVIVAEKSQQKDIRLSIQEARDLTAELAIMSSKLGKTVVEIHQMLSEIRDSTTNIDVKFDGGGFS